MLCGLIFAAAFGFSAAQTWQLERRGLSTILLGVSFRDEMNGMTQGFNDGEGPVVLITSNGGASYERTVHTWGNMMFMAGCFHDPRSAIVGGPGILTAGLQYTTNGQTFNDAEIPLGFPPFGVSVGCGNIMDRVTAREGSFGVVGQYIQGLAEESQQVATSINGGMSWTMHRIGDWVTGQAPASLIQLPSLNTWYIAGGRRPRSRPLDEGVFEHRINDHYSIQWSNNTTPKMVKLDPVSSEAPGWDFYVNKTIDGGRTWTSIYVREGYDISSLTCSDANICMVLISNPTEYVIMHTLDGGRTWNQRLRVSGGGATLSDLKMFDGREAWACGGVVQFPEITGLFYHTSDGGYTWQSYNAVNGALCSRLTLHPIVVGGTRYHGHATAILPLQGVSATLVLK